MAQKKAETLPVAKRKKICKSYSLILKYFHSKMPKFKRLNTLASDYLNSSHFPTKQENFE